MSFISEAVRDTFTDVDKCVRAFNLLESDQIEEAVQLSRTLEISSEKLELERRISDVIKNKIDALNFVSEEEIEGLAKIAYLTPCKEDRIYVLQELAVKLLFYMPEKEALEKVLELLLRSGNEEEESLLLSKICYFVLEESLENGLRIANMIKDPALKESAIRDIEILLKKKKK
jgi:hypothetical protein